jgi:valyl-tRNA synthetase
VDELTQAFHTLVPIIAPIAPHLAEELWHHHGKTDSVFLSEWKVEDVIAPVNIEPLLQLRSQMLSSMAARGIRSPAELDIALDQPFNSESMMS